MEKKQGHVEAPSSSREVHCQGTVSLWTFGPKEGRGRTSRPGVRHEGQQLLSVLDQQDDVVKPFRYGLAYPYQADFDSLVNPKQKIVEQSTIFLLRVRRKFRYVRLVQLPVSPMQRLNERCVWFVSELTLCIRSFLSLASHLLQSVTLHLLLSVQAVSWHTYSACTHSLQSDVITARACTQPFCSNDAKHTFAAISAALPAAVLGFRDSTLLCHSQNRR